MFRQDRDEFEDWKSIKCLGSGGNGEVHLWQNRTTRQRVAIKSLKFPPDRDDEKEKQRWRDEIAFAKQIQHDNIVQAITITPESFRQYLFRRYPPEPLIMEYCEKGDLRKKLSKLENMNGMPEIEVRSILECLRNAIVYLHSRGLTHRDIKPENLVIKEVNGCEVYKLTDLGYTRAIISTIEASHVGTFEYFAPEVITEPSYSNTVDYWSMGVIAFEIVCGIRPFLPGSPIKDFIQRIKAKGFEHIAITRLPETDEIKYHSTLFDQNHVSSCFKQLLERWLRIPLCANPRSRGIAADDVTTTANALSGKPVLKSPTNLRIFKDLDYMLSVKILTVFCMHNFRLFSYIISENTTRKGFLETLSLDTEIPVEDIVIVLPPENALITRFTSANRPIELYIDGLYEKPMVYCTTDKESLKDTIQNTGMSATLVKALEENTVKNQKHGLEVIRHIMFYVQKQGQFSLVFLQGLLNYAVMVDDWILKYQIKVDEMSAMFWQLQGAMQFYLLQAEHAKRMISEKNISTVLEDDSEKILERFRQIRELFSRTRTRYVSVLRRSKSTINDLNGNFNSFLKTVDTTAGSTTLYELYNKCRVASQESIPVIAAEVFRYFNSFQENNWFLHSPQIKNIETSVSEIHTEFVLIETVVDGLIKQQVDAMQSINQMACHFNQTLWTIATNAATANSEAAHIPNFDDILTEMKTNVADEKCELNYSFCNGAVGADSDWSSMSVSGEMQSLVEVNESLCDRIQKMLKDRVFDD